MQTIGKQNLKPTIEVCYQIWKKKISFIHQPSASMTLDKACTCVAVNMEVDCMTNGEGKAPLVEKKTHNPLGLSCTWKN